jgi:Protein of unknown function (DUF2924)
MAAQSRLETEIGRLADLPRDELVANWVTFFRNPPPRGVGRNLLELGIAWHMQARQLGGHAPSVRRHLQRLISDRERLVFDPDGEISSGEMTGLAVQDRVVSLAPSLLPGTRLVREWHGHTHHVDVIDDGFVYEGKCYPSLSAIARTITGARWSGPRFFGL